MATEMRRLPSETDTDFSSRTQLAPSSGIYKNGYSICRSSCARNALVLFFVILAAAAGGFALGYFLSRQRMPPPSPTSSPPPVADYRLRFQELVNPKKLEDNLREFTSRPHVTGSQVSRNITDTFVRKWKEYGFEVEAPEYDVLLSYPQEDNPNTITVINSTTGREEYKIIGKTNVTSGPDSNVTYPYLPYLAFSTNGTVEAELVYANNGHRGDYEELLRRNISVKGRLVIVRTLFTSIAIAEEYGASGVILYPDPIDYAPEGHGVNATYPNTPWLPPDGVQRLSLLPEAGDSLTPLLPSTEGIYRKHVKDAKVTKIPAQTISYSDALVLMGKLMGDKVPDAWRGALDVEYRFGVGSNSSNSTTNVRVRLAVHNVLRTTTIRNVIATIKGTHEPDRYILIGNHRDGWSYGAADPSSGSSTLAEISRILNVLIQEGWRPRRTLKLCSWGAEEFGLVGSIEWVEDYEKIIKERAVAYLNTDVAVGGNYVLFVQTSPMLYDLILDNTKKVKDPVNSDVTLYDTMLKRLGKSKYPNLPNLSSFRFSTDNIPFFVIAGLSTADFSFFFGHNDKYSLYPVYHTQYDNFDWIKRFADPNFAHFKAMTELLGRMVLDLTDSTLLPFSVQKYGQAAKFAFDSLERHNPTFAQYGISLDHFERAVEEFFNASEEFETAKSRFSGQQDSLVWRMLNDQMANLEKMFSSPDVNNDWAVNKRTLISYGFMNVDAAVYRSRKTGNGDEIKRQISIALHCVRSATRLVKPLV